MKKYKVRYYIEFEVSAENEDEALEKADKKLNSELYGEGFFLLNADIDEVPED